MRFSDPIFIKKNYLCKSIKERVMTRLLYPIGVQTFSKIREGAYVYVDKTEYVHKLVSTCQYVFLSRPRRFGKSLLLSTIKAFFEGRRELFEGLYISGCGYDWHPCPVLHLDFTGRNYSEPGSLDAHLNSMLEVWEAEYGSDLRHRAVEERFGNVIAKAAEKSGRKVVILIDEYDKPLLETVDKPELQAVYRDKLRALYGNLKRMDAHIRFAMLTGVTKFGHLSVFSDLNNLQDISLDEKYAGICGITDDELRKYFQPGVEALARRRALTPEEAFEKLRIFYDGYRFSPDGGPYVYNPFSLLNALEKEGFGDYWFRTGTPTFLVRMIHSGHLSLRELSEYQTGVSSLTDVSFDLGNEIPVLYQSGYLTIKDYDERFGSVTLGFPNKEVEAGFFNQLLPLYTAVPSTGTAFEISRFVKDVEAGRAEDFMIRLRSLFADFQYDSFNLERLERHYHDVLFIVVKLMGLYTRTEYRTSSGRIDMLIKTPGYIYVIEFKIDRSAEEALKQINERDYQAPFSAEGRKLIKIGVNFSSKLRSIESWIIEEA